MFKQYQNLKKHKLKRDVISKAVKLRPTHFRVWVCPLFNSGRVHSTGIRSDVGILKTVGARVGGDTGDGPSRRLHYALEILPVLALRAAKRSHYALAPTLAAR